MSRAAPVEWWLEQVDAARRVVEAARDVRSGPRPSGPLDDERRARGRVAPLPDRTPTQILISGVTITGGRDEERFRALPDASGGGARWEGPASTAPREAPIAGDFAGGGGGQGSGGLGRARRLAAGYQPAVIKVVSYARGATRAMATGQYVLREEVVLETHDGRLLEDREAVAEEVKAWSASFSKRAESQDVAAVWLKLQRVGDAPEGRETYEKAIRAGFEGHRYAYRLEATPAGALEARLVVTMAGASKERFRVREDGIGGEHAGSTRRRFDARSEEVIKERIERATGHSGHATKMTPSPGSHGRDGVTYRLNKLIENGVAIDDRGRVIANVAEARIAGREWGPSLRSQSSRDTMHLIVSAKAGTDVASLTNAARAFLHDRFADHKFMFGVHTDKLAEGHIHAHAIITVKNESGQKIHPSRDTFREWRKAYAEHAQAQGLKIVATSAKERASSQSYGPKDKAIVETAERPRPAREARDRAYAADPANRRLIDSARLRIQTARANPISLPTSERDRRIVKESQKAWSAIAHRQPENGAVKDMLERLNMAQTVGNILHTIEKRVDHLTKEDPGMAITSQQMIRDLRLMNEAVSRTTDLLEGGTREQFRQASSRYLETLANRIDLQRARERGVAQLSRGEVEKLVGAGADRLFERAAAIRANQQQEASSAQRLADSAVEAERRQEARSNVDPPSQRQVGIERAIEAGSQRSAAQGAREAAVPSPLQSLPRIAVESDALTKLRAEQERVLREIEGESSKAQSIKGQRII
jgi:type IV secretion system T-DNA border endonuclease VirD2